jgi:hypothetical protein
MLFSHFCFWELYDFEQNFSLRSKSTLHKGFPQRGRPAERPDPCVGGGQRPPPLWRLAFCLSLDFRSKACNSEKLLCEKTLLRPCDKRVQGQQGTGGPRPKRAPTRVCPGCQQDQVLKSPRHKRARGSKPKLAQGPKAKIAKWAPRL